MHAAAALWTILHLTQGNKTSLQPPPPHTHLDGVEAGVLGERVRHHLHGLGKGLDAVGVRARQRIGPLGQLVRKLRVTSNGER
eukprot:6211985-Pleurochrysis_carterae.AAC.7